MTEAKVKERAEVKRKTKAAVKAQAQRKADALVASSQPEANPVNTTNIKARSTGSEQSITRILDAAMEAASRQGLRNLSMSDVCRVAGVARGTLYRYFPSKEALLESLGQRTRQQTEAGIRAAAASATTGNECLAAVINFLVNLTVEAKAKSILEVEPQFFMDFIRRNLPHYSRLMADALAPFYDELDEALSHKVDRVICSEMIIRLQTSYIFIPDGRPREELMKNIFAAINEIK